MSTFTPTYGATAQPDGTTQFRFWAPNATQVDVVIDDGAPAAMTRESNGDFVAQATCRAGSRYRFRIDGDLAVPDPASRLQDGDVHDASVVTAPDAFAWQHTEWRGRPFEETVLYELHPGLCGGFNGIAVYEMCSPLRGGGSLTNLDACASGYLEWMRAHHRVG